MDMSNDTIHRAILYSEVEGDIVVVLCKDFTSYQACSQYITGAMGTMMPNPYGDMETIIYATLSTQTASGRWTTDAEYHTML
jgi:hypothetical protein